jgi:hypothetical protein
MRLLTIHESADLLSEGLGRNVKATSLERAIKEGRIRGQKAPEGQKGYVIPSDELVRILEETYRDVDDTAQAWDLVPSRGSDLLWGTGRKRRERPPSSLGDKRVTALIERLRAME